MRRTWQWMVSLCLIGGLAVALRGQAGDAAATIAAARQALGGEKKLSAVTSFVTTGRTRQVRGDNLVPIEFEIDCALPDKYVRKDEVPAQENGPTSSGFNGDDLIQLPAPPPPAPMAARPGGPPPPDPAVQLAAMRKTRVMSLKQDFARLTLGMFVTSFSSLPLTFTYDTVAEAPQGKADVLDVKGPGNFSARLFIDQKTHLPLMLSWQAVSPSAAPRGMGPSAPGRAAAPPPPENRLYFAEYRDVDGLQLPFRLRRAVGPDTTEETIFDGFKLNTKIDPKKFEPVK